MRRWDSWHWPCCRYQARLLPASNFLGIKPGNGFRVPFRAQPPHLYYQSPARSLPRPTLVFWRFGALICIVVFFMTVEASGLDFLFWGLDIDSNGRGLLSSVLLPLVPESLLLFLLVSLLSQLRHIVTWRGWIRILGFWFFGAGWVLVAGALGLHLRKSIVGRAVAPGATGIRFSDHGAGF